jgi:hypothetical protein
MDHLTEDATIRGALKELVDGNGWQEVIGVLDVLLADPGNFDTRQNPDAENVDVPMQVNVSFPRRRTLSEEGQADFSKLYPTDN